jgi:hypothetical protein
MLADGRLGNASTNSTLCGALNPANLVLANAMIDSASGFSTAIVFTASPHFSSGTPITPPLARQDARTR